MLLYAFEKSAHRCSPSSLSWSAVAGRKSAQRPNSISRFCGFVERGRRIEYGLICTCCASRLQQDNKCFTPSIRARQTRADFLSSSSAVEEEPCLVNSGTSSNLAIAARLTGEAFCASIRLSGKSNLAFSARMTPAGKCIVPSLPGETG